MECRDVRERLDAYADAEVPSAERQTIEDHLRSCGPCGSALDHLRKLGRVLGGASVPGVPEGFAGRVMARAKERIARPTPALPAPARFGLIRAAWRVAAGLVVGLGAGGLMGLDAFRPPPVPVAAVRPEESADPLAEYGLDFLGDAPSGSLAQTYASLTSDSAQGGD